MDRGNRRVNHLYDAKGWRVLRWSSRPEGIKRYTAVLLQRQVKSQVKAIIKTAQGGLLP